MNFEEFWTNNESAIKQQVKAMFAAQQAEKKKIEPKGGAWWIENGTVTFDESTKETRLFGLERKTEELATKAAEKMRIRNVLAALVDEHCGGYEFVFGEANWYIYQRYNGKFMFGCDKNNKIIGATYMPIETAEYLYAALTDGWPL